MDGGTKGFFRKLKRIQFWIICPLVILVGLISWWMAIGSIQKQRDSNKSRIDGLYSTLRNESSKDRHANDKVSEGMEALISKRRDEVAEAWTERWNQQTAKADIFQWPEVLTRQFISKVEHLRPIETTVGFPPAADQKLAINLKRKYRDYIKDELPKLAEQIGAVWSPTTDGRGGRRGAGRSPRIEGGDEGGRVSRQDGRGENTFGGGKAFDQSLVDWSSANQGEIETEHFDWTDAPPNLLEILYAHEDLTVFRSIMNVVSKANEGATTRFDATVKEIEFIRIGRNATGNSGQITSALASPVGGAMMREGGGMMREGGMQSGRPEGMMRERGMQTGRPEGIRIEGGENNVSFQAPMADPADLRYVDKNYLALPATELRNVLKKPIAGEPSEPIDPTFAYLAVAKRIPVRMRMRVDQRKLNRLLSECANSELTIEIRQVRINPDKKTGSSASAGRGRGLRDREGGGRSQGNSRNSSEELFQYDIDVELYGIVYVYNPVNKEVLGIEEETEEPADEGVPVASN